MRDTERHRFCYTPRMADDWIPIELAAAEFQLHRSTIYRAISEGKLNRFKSMGDPRTYVDRGQLLRIKELPQTLRCLDTAYRHFREKGEWPVMAEVQRQLIRNGDTFDFIGAVQSLPRELAWQYDPGGRVRLTLRGIARCENAGEDLDDFIRILGLCFEKYVGPEERPRLTNEDLERQLGMNALKIQKMWLLLELESFLFAGGGANPSDGSWFWEVSDRIRYFRDVRTIYQYLAAKDQLIGSRPASAPHSVPVPTLRPGPPASQSKGTESVRPVRRQGRDGNRRSDQATHLHELHPIIRGAAGQLYKDGHYGPAVLEAAKAFQQLVRQTSHLQLDGKALLERAFTEMPLADLGTATGRSLQEGLRHLAVGSLLAFRNPLAHSSQTLDAVDAREALVVFSLLARRIQPVTGGPETNELPTSSRPIE